MNFNTTSFIAGVGSVVVVLSTGFAGGYFLASPAHINNPPNRLQRLAAEDHTAPAIPTSKPELVAAATPAAASVAPAANPAPAPAAVRTAPAPAAAPTPTVQQAAVTPPAAAAPAEVKAPEPARTANAQETAAPVVVEKAADKTTDKVSTPKPSADADKERSSEAKYVERRRSDSRRIAEQQRKQRELEVATVAVRRIIHDRDAPDVMIRERRGPDMVENDPPEAPGPAMPRFNLFGQ